jgi:AraC family transcriptional regulator, alkane utilization regulator
MTRTPDHMIETPELGAKLAGPNGTDVLSEALRVFRVRGAALLCGEYSAPWAWDAPSAGEIAALLHPGAQRVVVFHIVAQGRCWLELEGHPRVQLNEGDVVGFPHGHAHRMGNGNGAKPFPVAKLFPSPPWREVPVLRRVDGGEPTRIVCVYLRCDDQVFNPLLASLPALLLVRAQQEGSAAWIETNVRYIVSEAGRPRPGNGYLMARLTELLFVEILRAHIAKLGERDVGWLAALKDRHVARALHAFHMQPSRPWTVAALARHVGLSRSALVERFQRLLGTSPMRYLTLWRLQLAAQALAGSQDGVGAIAAQIGYRSEEAFSRAFKRRTGRAPAAWRRSARGPDDHARPGSSQH